MKSRMLSLLAAYAVAAISAVAPIPAQAYTFVDSSALACHYIDQLPTTPPPDLRYQWDGLYNAGSTDARVACPITWSPIGNATWVQVSGNGPTSYVWGIVYAYGFDGTYHSSAYFDNYDFWGYYFWAKIASLYPVTTSDVVTADIVMGPGAKLRGFRAQN